MGILKGHQRSLTGNQFNIEILKNNHPTVKK